MDLGLSRLRLRLRRTKVVMPSTAKTAATPPITPLTIAPMFPFRTRCDGDDGDDGDDDGFVSPGSPLAFIIWAGTLRNYPSQD